MKFGVIYHGCGSNSKEQSQSPFPLVVVPPCDSENQEVVHTHNCAKRSLVIYRAGEARPSNQATLMYPLSVMIIYCNFL